MDINTLKERISKKENQITKINKRIAKWSAGLTDEQANMPKIKTGNDIWDMYKHNLIDYDTYSNMSELRRAYIDLNETTETLNKYYNALQYEEAKANEEKIPVIVEFLNEWKKDVVEYIIVDVKEHMVKFYEIRNELRELCEYSLTPSVIGMTREEWHNKYTELNALKKMYYDVAHSISKEVYSADAEDNVNHEELDKILEKEMQKRYNNLVTKVTKVTGKIIDASYLTIGVDGNLNGIIVGEDGKAKVNTIGAGGYNIQCYHFRTLVHKI